MKASPALSNFNTGELSPLLAGRTDFDKYPNGASLLENFIPTTQGPNVRRGGTRYIGSTRYDGRVLLVPFEYSVDQAYVLEFGQFYVRFYTWDAVTKERGLLTDGAGNPVQVVTPYTVDDLYRPDGTPRLRFAQSGDFLYLVNGIREPRLLKRLSATSFTLERFQPKGGPFDKLNDGPITVYASAAAGSVTLTSSANLFTAGMIGSLIYLESKDVNAVPPWEVSKAITVGMERRSDGKTYKALNAATTGTNRPVHTEGALFDGDGGVQWQYQDPGYGHARITSVAGPTAATGEVIEQLPSQVVGSGNATTRWALGEWSEANGWPTDVCFFRERLWFGRRQKVWSSVSAGFDDFSARNFGQVTADMGISVTLVSGRINDVQWLSADKGLVAGTAGAEFSIGELTNGEPLGPDNRKVSIMSQFGTRAIPPIKNNESLLFVQRSGLKARETFYDFSSDGYKSTDTTVLAEHITKTGITQMAFAADPDQIVWSTRADGQLLGFTWNNEQNVRGWHRHPIGGSGVVESIAVIPAAEGDRSELWMVVLRTINGVTKRYVEYMTRPYRDGDTQASQLYMDAALTYDGTKTKTITGLDHLEGCEVSILTDGAPHPNQVVAGGAVQLQWQSSIVNVGLPCDARYRSMRIEAGASDGTAQGKTKRIHKAVLRLHQTGSCTYGPMKDGGFMDKVVFRRSADRMDQPVPLFTGDKVVQWPNGYETGGCMAVVVDQPVACTVVAIYPQIVTQDAR